MLALLTNPFYASCSSTGILQSWREQVQIKVSAAGLLPNSVYLQVDVSALNQGLCIPTDPFTLQSCYLKVRKQIRNENRNGKWCFCNKATVASVKRIEIFVLRDRRKRIVSSQIIQSQQLRCHCTLYFCQWQTMNDFDGLFWPALSARHEWVARVCFWSLPSNHLLRPGSALWKWACRALIPLLSMETETGNGVPLDFFLQPCVVQ